MSEIAQQSLPVTLIRPRRGLALPSAREVWHNRELLWFLVLRNLKVRYTQAALGATWAVIQPALTMIVFTIFFGRLSDVPSDGVPYHLFALAGLVPWTYFSTTLTFGSQSLVSDAALITKIYVPRVIIPLASVLSGLVDLALAGCLLLLLMVIAGEPPGPEAVLAVPLVLLVVVAAAGWVLWLSALNVKYRDIRFTVPFLVQLWLFLTPIAYPASLVKGGWRIVYALNPMAGAVEGFRFVLLDTGTDPWGMVAVSAVVSIIVLVTGGLYFRQVDSSFADVV